MSDRVYEDVIFEVARGRATITINRPDRLNALRRRTVVEMIDAFEHCADEETIGVIVLTGAGDRAFCVGADIRDPTRTTAEKRSAHHLVDRLGPAMRNNGKPIIARVAGYCIGAGNELNMVCDLTIAAATARFGQAGPKIGTAPLWWGCSLIPLVVGEKRAREVLFMTGQYTADQAVAMGLANVAVPDDELDATVDAWCTDILRRSPIGLRMAKLALNAASDLLHSSNQHGYELMTINHIFGDEPKEGIAAFRDNRAIDWRRFRAGQGPAPADR